MKRIVTVLMLCALFVVASPVSAQASGSGGTKDIPSQSSLYPLRIDVVQILVHAQGYRVIYRKGSSELAAVHLPSAWFVSGGKAALIRGRGPEYPYMVVYYKEDGSISHIKLYAKDNIGDSSWGTIQGDPGDAFKVDTIKLEY